MDLYELLDCDRDEPENQNARALVKADRDLIASLVKLREDRHMNQAQVADLMGCDRASVSRFESGTRDPHLSTIRRYALAIRAGIRHEVQPFTPPVVPPSVPGDDDAWTWKSASEDVRIVMRLVND